MKEKKTLSPVAINLKKLLKPCKDWERVSSWKESLLELERETGIAETTTRGWFSGKNIPSFTNVQAIANYKKVDVYDQYVNEDRWVKIYHVSPERQEIMKKLAEMPDDQFFNTVNLNMFQNETTDENETEEKTQTGELEENKPGEGDGPSPK